MSNTAGGDRWDQLSPAAETLGQAHIYVKGLILLLSRDGENTHLYSITCPSGSEVLAPS